MNNKPWAYVTSAWSADRSRAKRSAKRYCRKLYEAGCMRQHILIRDLQFILKIKDRAVKRQLSIMSRTELRHM